MTVAKLTKSLATNDGWSPPQRGQGMRHLAWDCSHRRLFDPTRRESQRLFAYPWQAEHMKPFFWALCDLAVHPRRQMAHNPDQTRCGPCKRRAAFLLALCIKPEAGSIPLLGPVSWMAFFGGPHYRRALDGGGE